MTDRLIELGKPAFVAGYGYGMQQPSVLISLRLTRFEIRRVYLERFDELWSAAFPLESLKVSGVLTDPLAAAHPVLSRVLGLCLGLLNKLGMPVMSGVRVVQPAPATPHDWELALPAISAQVRAPYAALVVACDLMNRLELGEPVREGFIAAQLGALQGKYERLAPAGVNTLRFLQAAHEMDIPWRHVANNVYQFGWGSRSRWLDSSFTDQTSIIGAGLARDKVACAHVLRDAGLPVPRHRLVASSTQAVSAAESMGYPVVVKPANLDGGRGVMAGLQDADAVKKAFLAAFKLSKRVLVEQYIDGMDYRVRVCNGDVIGVVIRRPACVVGDGVHTVQFLIDQTNAQRASQPTVQRIDIEQGVYPIAVDDEVLDRLKHQGLDLQSVVKEGQVLRLRGAANVSLGGTTWDVTGSAHPDNLVLAGDAVRALRLDLAGVDLLVPDISRSWKETGGAICEVNAQPQFSSTSAHRHVLERLLPSQGRIPVIGVLGWPDEVEWASFAALMTAHHGVRLAVARTAAQCSSALLDSQTDALIWLLSDETMNSLWWPVDRLDLWVDGSESTDRSAGVMQLPHVDRWSVAKCGDGLDGAALLERLRGYLKELMRQGSLCS